MKKILIVDDDAHIRTLVRTYAEAEGYGCEEASGGEEALESAHTGNYDLILLDVMMPGMDGFEVLSRLRRDSDTPVIMLTARKEEYDKLYGFGLGADDYVPKPFSPRELMARASAVIRRGRSVGAGTMKFGLLEISEQSRSVTVQGREVSLTPKEFDLLLYMAKNGNVALDRDRLLKNVWGFDYYGDTRTVDTHVKSLREHLGSCRNMISTVWGVGYRFDGKTVGGEGDGKAAGGETA